MLITYEALVKENALLAGKLRLDNSEQIKNCLGKNSGNKTSAEGEREGKGEGRKQEEWAKDNETHKTPTPLSDNNFIIIIINTFH